MVPPVLLVRRDDLPDRDEPPELAPGALACASCKGASGSSVQYEPLPGSFGGLGTRLKDLFRDRLWRIEFCVEQDRKVRNRRKEKGRLE